MTTTTTLEASRASAHGLARAAGTGAAGGGAEAEREAWRASWRAERARLRVGADEALGAAVDAVVEVERMMASLAAVRARLVDDAVRIADLAEVVGGASAQRRQELAFRSVRAELAAATRWSERYAERVMSTSVSLVADCPATLAALGRGAISARHADLVVEQARSIDDPAARAAFDETAAGLAESLSPARFASRVRDLRERMHPRPREERHAEAAAARRVVREPGEDCMSWFSAYLPAVEAVAIEDRVTRIARLELEQPGEQRTLDQIRADVVAALLLDAPVDPRVEARAVDVGRFRGIRPTVLVTVPALTLLGHEGQEPAVVEGVGPIDDVTARELTANAPGLYRVLTDPHTGAVLDLSRDRYRIPTDLRLLLRVRDGTCRAVGCGRSTAGCDLDHTVDWARGGTTSVGNLANLCPSHHTLKHHGGWRVRQEAGGDLVWTTPLGRVYRTAPALRVGAGAGSASGARAGPAP